MYSEALAATERHTISQAVLRRLIRVARRRVTLEDHAIALANLNRSRHPKHGKFKRLALQLVAYYLEADEIEAIRTGAPITRKNFPAMRRSLTA